MLVLSLLLFFFAAVGNAAVGVFQINWLYGTRFRGWWVTLIRYVNQAAIVGLPIVFLACWGPRAVWRGEWMDLPAPVLAYLGLCWTLGFGVVPYQTGKRWRRVVPAVQSANHTHTLDVAKLLGEVPYGRGRFHWLARLPGNQIFQVDFVEKTLALPQMPPEWDGLTILHISDPHLCGIPGREYYDFVMSHLAASQAPPDILVVTGDIIDETDYLRWIVPVFGRLTREWGRDVCQAFGILGNHDARLDTRKIIRRMERVGIEMIGGRWVGRRIRGRELVVAGTEMPWIRPHPDLSGCPAGDFRLCLSHTPDVLPWAKQNRIDLMLSGHNHGGQVRIPGFGPVLVPSTYSRRYDAGLFLEPPTLMYVSRGLGGTYPLRLFCRPEITRFVLRAPSISSK